ncbi:ATP-binding protein [Corynebacterium flavescens]|uniref:ATP-binding protein n=1 Tax=Corynebacterium flavescens TaxID=28028 RepID=UPI00289B264F|nr:ATP-binding protein [Corynebacterium flavescens]
MTDFREEAGHNEITPTIERLVHLAPKAAIHKALGANHDLRTGLDELIDNSIDAGAKVIAVVFHIVGLRLVQISVHDDGSGMTQQTLEDVLSLGGHIAHTKKNIGRYGMGLKEGSFANADLSTIVSRPRGQRTSGIRLSKESFEAGILDEASANRVWNLRAGLVELKSGTSIVWNKMNNVYRGGDDMEARKFLDTAIESTRKHVGIRYHRFLAEDRLSVNLYSQFDEGSPRKTGGVRAIDPFAYRRTGNRAYPQALNVGGDPSAPGIVAHIWPNRSKIDQFNLEGKDELGHQGFYIYDADRLITQGGWSGYRSPNKHWKLLRIVIDEPRVIDKYVTVSPQKGSVRLSEDFDHFIRSLRAPGDPDKGFAQVLDDAKQTLSDSNKKSGAANPLAETGKGISRRVQEAVWASERLKATDPIDIEWGKLEDGKLIKLEPARNLILLNEDYREYLNRGNSDSNDAPLFKALIYLLFNDSLSSARWTAKAESNAELWISIVEAALQEEMESRPQPWFRPPARSPRKHLRGR